MATVYRLTKKQADELNQIVSRRCEYCKNGCCTAISVLNDDTCVQFENSKMIACPYAMRALFSSARNNDLLFRIINNFRDTNTNSFTAKLKYLRQYRKMTQKELGMKIGFPEKSAGVRIAQYESGTRLPKIERMDKIADALDFPHSVFRTLTTVEVMILLEVLPQLEERFGKDYALLKLIGNKTTQTIYDWLSIYPKYFEDEDTKEDNNRWSNTITNY